LAPGRVRKKTCPSFKIKKGARLKFRVALAFNSQGTADFFVKKLEQVFNPEFVITEKAFLHLVIGLEFIVFQIVTDIFENEYQGLTFGLTHTQNLSIENLQKGYNVFQYLKNAAGKKSFPGWQLKILFSRQVFCLEQAIKSINDMQKQEISVFFVEFAFFKLKIGEKNRKKLAHPHILTEMRIHHMLQYAFTGNDYINIGQDCQFEIDFSVRICYTFLVP
jgi:hypothetical protein